MFYYLNEPIEGGETAFPFADNVTYDSSVRILVHVCLVASFVHEHFGIDRSIFSDTINVQAHRVKQRLYQQEWPPLS